MINYQLKCIIALCITVPLINTCDAAPAAMTYGKIGNQLISSYGAIGSPTLTAEEKKKKDEQILLEIPQLCPQEKDTIVFSTFDKHEQIRTEETNNPQLRELQTLARDLELFYALDDKNHLQHLFSVLDNTETSFGKAILAHMLISPTTDITVLQSRQMLINQLVNDREQFKKTEVLVKQIKSAEPGVCSYWVEENPATKNFINSFYVGKASWDKSNTAMEAYVRLGNVTKTIYPIAGPMVMEGVTNRLTFQFLPQLKELCERVGMPTTTDSYLGDIVLQAKLSFFPHFLMRSIAHMWSINKASGALLGGILVGSSAFKLYSIKNVLTQAQLVKNTINHLQARLIDVSTLISTARTLHKMAQKDDTINAAISSFDQMSGFFEGIDTGSDEFSSLVKTLETNTFKGQPSFFSLSGRVLACHKLMTEHKDKFAPILMFVGEFDAALSIAKLYKKHSMDSANYCFVQYQDGATPYIKLEGFWNPIVNPDFVVTNDLELGKPGSNRNIILTGANTGGKSTLMKAMMISVLMSQTFGIAPAYSATITPFDYLATSLNIIDNTAQGKSAYQAEVDRAALLINTASQMEKDNKICFMIIDEMFKGTTPEKADIETHDCVKILAAHENVSLILATHYLNNPIKLEVETDGICKNFRIDAREIDGQIIRTYKMEEGVTQHSLASALLKNAISYGTTIS